MEALNLVRVVNQPWGPIHAPHAAYEYEVNGRYATVGVWMDGRVFVYWQPIERVETGTPADGFLTAQLRVMEKLCRKR